MEDNQKICKCDGCGKIAPCNDDWRFWGTIRHFEECFDEQPTSCSDDCGKIVKQNLESGEFKLPKLKVYGPYADVVGPRKGY